MATCQIIRVFDTVKQLSKRRHFIPSEMAYSFMRSGYRESPSLLRFMTTGRRVQDRSKKKRVHDLEIATEKFKLASKILFLMEVLKREPEQVIPLRSLEHYRRHINLPKPHKISDFLRKSPKLFELYKDHKRVLWCGMTKEAEDLVEEEAKILEEHGEKAAEHVTRLLMMTVDKRLSMDKIAHFRRDFGLPYDFRTRWAYKYPQCFRVVKSEDDAEYLELVSCNPSWAVTELEKKVNGVNESNPPTPGLLTLPFPMKFPPNCKKIFRFGGKIEHFQKRCYLSPYADARGLKAGSQEFDKRAVAVMHELLSFTIDKRVVTDHLTHFRQELVMPQKLMRLLLKHFGIFYVSERGKRFNVFLTEAYDGSELIQKCPLVVWREKVQALIGYRGRQQRIESFSDFSDMEGYDNLFDSDFRGNAIAELESEDSIAGIEDLSAPDHEMEVGEIYTAYTGS